MRIAVAEQAPAIPITSAAIIQIIAERVISIFAQRVIHAPFRGVSTIVGSPFCGYMNTFFFFFFASREFRRAL